MIHHLLTSCNTSCCARVFQLRVLTNRSLLRLFHRSPPARVLFGFPIDIDPDSDDLRFSKRFVTQAMYMIQMLDSSISMLGPDIDMLSEIMVNIMLAKLFVNKHLFRSHLASFRRLNWELSIPGESSSKFVYESLCHLVSDKHCVFSCRGRYGVQPEMFTVMGDCLIEMLSELLPGGLSTEAEAAWQTTYKELSQDMIRAYVA
jgi:hypothetical protein